MSNFTSDFQTSLFVLLNKEVEYVVLRNYEGLPERNNSRDIDIAITRRDYNCIRSRLVELVEKFGWEIVTFLKSDRLVTWVLGYLGNDHDTELIQLDFFFNTSVFGIELLSATELIKDRRFNGKVYYPSVEIQFLDKYIYDRAVGAEYPSKYCATRKAAKDSDVVKQKIKNLFGCDSVEECDKTGERTLLIRAIGRNLRRRPFGLIGNVVRFYQSFIGNYLTSRTGFSLGFTGPDGVGKTTVINLLIESLGDVFRKAHTYFHFRPALFGNLGEVAHSAGIKKEVDRNYSDPHRGGKTGMLSSIARLCYYSVDYIVGYFLKIKPVIRITRLAIFDRYFTDIICDSRRSRIYLPPKFLNVWRKLFIPSLDYNILLTADTKTILQRKQELDSKGIEAINAKINYLAGKKGYYKIMNDGTPQEAVAKILRIVFQEQHRKNVRRLNQYCEK